jgi:hypothetical protein
MSLSEINALSGTELIEDVQTFNSHSNQELIDILESVSKNMESGTNAGGNANCFDYYRFGSVQVPITPNLTSTVPGSPMNFSGVVRNENNYPIIDGAVYVKIFKLEDTIEKSVNGPDVVDQFFVKKDIVVPANSEVPIDFFWNVPAWSGEGQYQVAAFFVSSDKYNLLGLSFTDDIVGNVAYFNVVAGGANRDVYLNKGTVTYPKYDLPHLFAGFPHRFDKNEPVDITFEVINTTNSEQKVRINYTVYSWDAMSEKNVVSTVAQSVDVAANKKLPPTRIPYPGILPPHHTYSTPSSPTAGKAHTDNRIRRPRAIPGHAHTIPIERPNAHEVVIGICAI